MMNIFKGSITIQMNDLISLNNKYYNFHHPFKSLFIWNAEMYRFLLHLHMQRFCPVGRSFFSPDIRKPQKLGDGLEAWCGFYQSIRPTQMGLSLNIGIFMLLLYRVTIICAICSV